MKKMLTSRGTRIALLWALGMMIYSAVVMGLFPELEVLDRPVTEAALALGAGLLLGIRINRAYERWWEARTLWGSLVNVSRNLAVKTQAFTRPASEEAERMARLIGGFAFALKGHLREGVALQAVPGLEQEPAKPTHVPLWIAGRIYEHLAEWDVAGRITPEQLWPLDREARSLMDICGACERIHNTPMPPSLGGLTRLVMLIGAAALPWVLYDVGPLWYVAIAVGVATFFMLVVETTAAVIERPFGRDPNQLPLDDLCRTIRTTVREALGVPAPDRV